MTLASVALLALLSGALATASLIGVDAVLVIAGVAAAVAAIEVSSGVRRSGTPVVPYAVSGLAVCVPVAARFRGESGVLEAAAVLVVILGAMHVIRAPRERVTASASAEVLFAVLIGAACAYLVLLASRADGQRLLTIMGAMVLAARAAAFAVDRSGKRLAGHAAGAAAAIAVGVAAAVLFSGHLGTAELLIVGAVVAGAASLSSVAGEMVRLEASEARSPGLAFAALEPFLFAAPAFFYAVKLYLS